MAIKSLNLDVEIRGILSLEAVTNNVGDFLTIDTDNVVSRRTLSELADELELDNYQLLSEKGEPNGYAPLDNAGKVPVEFLPNAIMIYKGTWDPTTNTPTLTDGVGDPGDVYKIINSPFPGTDVDLGSGVQNFTNGDFVIYNGSIWEKSDGSDSVFSVNGLQGAVQLDLSFTEGVLSLTGSTEDINFDDRYYTETEIDTLLDNYEPIFSKGDLIQGTGVSLTGTLIERLVGTGNITVSLSTETQDSLALADTALQPGDNISELTNDVPYLITETDPIFSASPAAGITLGNITNWNTTYNRYFGTSITTGNQILLSSGETDLDSLTLSNAFITTNYVNGPTGAGSNGIVTNYEYSSGSYYRTFMDYSNNRLFFRGNSQTNLTNTWLEVATREYLGDNFYTQIELQTSGQAQVHWDNLTDVPSLTFTDEFSELSFGASSVKPTSLSATGIDGGRVIVDAGNSWSKPFTWDSLSTGWENAAGEGIEVMRRSSDTNYGGFQLFQEFAGGERPLKYKQKIGGDLTSWSPERTLWSDFNLPDPASNGDVVHLTGDETIAGTKLFSNPLTTTYTTPDADGAAGSGNSILGGLSRATNYASLSASGGLTNNTVLTFKASNARIFQFGTGTSSSNGFWYRPLHTTISNTWTRVWDSQNLTNPATETYVNNAIAGLRYFGTSATTGTQITLNNPIDLDTLSLSNAFVTTSHTNGPSEANNGIVTNYSYQSGSYFRTFMDYGNNRLWFRGNSLTALTNPWLEVAPKEWVNSQGFLTSPSTLQEVTTGAGNNQTTNVIQVTGGNNDSNTDGTTITNQGFIVRDGGAFAGNFVASSGGMQLTHTPSGQVLVITPQNATQAGIFTGSRIAGAAAENIGEYLNGNNIGDGLEWDESTNTVRSTGPVFEFGSFSPNFYVSGGTVSNVQGSNFRYQRVGNSVTVWLEFNISDATSTNGSGVFRWELPYASDNVYAGSGKVPFSSEYTPIVGGTFGQFENIDGTDGSFNELQALGNGWIVIQITYITNE